MTLKFSKAAAQQARLKVSMYGPPGSGKTFTALLMAEGLANVRGRRVAYVDTERGTDFYSQAVPARQIHPEAFDFDAIYTKSLADVGEAVRGLDAATHGVVVLDSVSHIWEAATDAYEGKRVGRDKDKIPFGAWAQIKRPYKALIAWLIASPFDVFILGRQRAVYEDVDYEPKKVGVQMKAEGDTQYEPHICFRMEARRDPADSAKSIYECHVEKDRTGVLAGRVVRNPSFATIEGLLPLLGETQAPAEDEDERVAKDGALLSEANDKDERKAAKSRELLVTLQASAVACRTIDDVGKFGQELRKQRKYLLSEHEAALVEVGKSVRDKIVAAATEGVG